MIDFFEHPQWQMTVGERAALVGVVSQLKPELAVEIGTAEGGSLHAIADHAAEVHSFDLVPPSFDPAKLPHVRFHTGDSHELLPAVLREFERSERRVDFALVDGDHERDGVTRDVADLLASGAVSQTVILLHDTANEAVRAGIEAVDLSHRPDVLAVDLDFVPGYLVKADRFHHEIWGGLGLIVVGQRAGAPDWHLTSQIAYPQTPILTAERERLSNGTGGESSELERLRTTVAELQRKLDAVIGSKSWRVTAPLRRIAERGRETA